MEKLEHIYLSYHNMKPFNMASIYTHTFYIKIKFVSDFSGNDPIINEYKPPRRQIFFHIIHLNLSTEVSMALDRQNKRRETN